MFVRVTGGMSLVVGGLNPASVGLRPVLMIGGCSKVDMAFGPDSAIEGVRLDTEVVVEVLRIEARRRDSWFGKG